MATEPKAPEDKGQSNLNSAFDKMFSAIDGLCSRLDAIEEKADKARKDAEEAAGEREKAMKDELETLKSHVNLQPEDRAGYGEAQARADAVYRLTGKQAPPPMAGERVLDYRKRLLGALQHESPEFQKISLPKATQDVVDAIEGRIFADAAAAARDTARIPAGTMHKIEKRDATGRTITEWYGSWMASQPVPPISLRRVRPELMAGRI